MNKKIGPFTLYTKKPNDINFGHIYTMEVKLPLPHYSKRTVRVFLPEDFDESKKYPLLVMSDGQNIVDKYTSAYGAWEIDKRQHEHLQEGYKSFIVVGIDCPKGVIERAYEYSFPHMHVQDWEEGRYTEADKLEPYSHLLYEYIAMQLVPIIRKYFPISDKREDIACGGSSMGGVYALSLITSYPEVFGTALCFSPGFFLYNHDEMYSYLKDRLSVLDKDHRLFFYSGNVGFENRFLEDTKGVYEFYKAHGYKKIDLVIDLEAEHNEYCWSMHFPEAIRFWQDL